MNIDKDNICYCEMHGNRVFRAIWWIYSRVCGEQMNAFANNVACIEGLVRCTWDRFYWPYYAAMLRVVRPNVSRQFGDSRDSDIEPKFTQWTYVSGSIASCKCCKKGFYEVEGVWLCAQRSHNLTCHISIYVKVCMCVPPHSYTYRSLARVFLH